jgi:hypothetical protein
MDERYFCMQHLPLPMQDAMSWCSNDIKFINLILKCQWFIWVVKNFILWKVEVTKSVLVCIYPHESKSAFFFGCLQNERGWPVGLWKRSSKDFGCSRENESGRDSRPHTCPRDRASLRRSRPFVIHLYKVRSYTHTLPSLVHCHGFKGVVL